VTTLVFWFLLVVDLFLSLMLWVCADTRIKWKREAIRRGYAEYDSVTAEWRWKERRSGER
jgi:hypothetical protein